MRHLPTQRPGTLTTRGGPKVYHGSLGSQEMLTLTVSRYRRRRQYDDNLLNVRVEGAYDVYCGNGSEHRIEISFHDLDTVANSAVAAIWTRSDEEAASTLLDHIIAGELEDWTDPCDDYDEEDGDLD